LRVNRASCGSLPFTDSLRVGLWVAFYLKCSPNDVDIFISGVQHHGPRYAGFPLHITSCFQQRNRWDIPQG
jgi:hypothetical protein